MDYDAVGISRLDLAAGADFLLEQKKKSDFAWLSANLVNRETGKPLFDPYITTKKAGLRIAVIGITGLKKQQALPGQIKIKPLFWKDVLPGLMKELQAKSDLIILLSSLDPVENEEISNQFPALNILVQSGTRPRNISPRLVNNTLICQTDKQGKYLGKLNIRWNESGEWKNPGKNQLLLKKQEYDRISWQLKRLEKKGDPEVIYKDKPANLRAYHKLTARQKILESELRNFQAENKMQSDKAAFDNTFLELAPEVTDDIRLTEIILDTKRKVNAVGRNQTVKNMIPGYVGGAVCADCHKNIAEKWAKTGHARALQTLVQKEQQFNTNCLPCHVTGISMEEKNNSLSLPEALYNVGCESCHGPGKEHAAAPEKTNIDPHPSASVCLQCHSSEHDDAFNYESDHKKIH